MVTVHNEIYYCDGLSTDTKPTIALTTDSTSGTGKVQVVTNVTSPTGQASE